MSEVADEIMDQASAVADKVVGDPVLFEAPPMAEQERMVEAMLFASSEPLTSEEMGARMPHGTDVGEAIARLRKRYDGRGVNLVKVGNAWAIRTAGEPRLRKFAVYLCLAVPLIC